VLTTPFLINHFLKKKKEEEELQEEARSKGARET